MRLIDKKTSLFRPDIRGFLASDLGRAGQKYLVVGGLSALADWALFALLLYGFELHYIVAATISFVIATALNYVMSVRFVFGASRRGARNAMMLVYAVSAVGIVINLAVLSAGVDVFGLHPLVAKVIASSMAVFWNFLARYFYIFR